jgi:hypothetical protein
MTDYAVKSRARIMTDGFVVSPDVIVRESGRSSIPETAVV